MLHPVFLFFLILPFSIFAARCEVGADGSSDCEHGKRSVEPVIRAVFDQVRKSKKEFQGPQAYSEQTLVQIVQHPDDSDRILGYFISTGENAGAPVALYIHGGGYFGGDALALLGYESTPIIEAGYNIFSVEYGLVPEYHWHTQVVDVIAAYEWLLIDKKIPSEKIVVVGCSSGGGLAAIFLNAIQGPEKQHPDNPNNRYYAAPKPLPNPRAALIESPWLDLELKQKSIFTCFNDVIPPKAYGDLSAYIPYFFDQAESWDVRYYSPIYMDPTGWPETFFTVGSSEGFLDETLKMSQKAEDAGVDAKVKVYPAMNHCGINAFQLPELAEISKIYDKDRLNFLNQVLKKKPIHTIWKSNTQR